MLDHPVAYLAMIFAALLLLMPPSGVLSDNEENYFALAWRFVAHDPPPANTAIFDASHHRAVFELLLGTLIATIGFAKAQMVTRVLAAAGYAVALRAVFRLLSLSATDAVLVIASFALLGQQIIGGEWLFSGFEEKVAAYCIVLAGLSCVMAGRSLIGAALLFALATYMHFLVGAFWFVAAMALRLLDGRRVATPVAAAGGLYALATAPLFGVILWSRHAAAARPDDTLPPPDVIYSIIRLPHHTSPFLSRDYFVLHWLPGYGLAALMLGVAVVIVRRSGDAGVRRMAFWLCGLLVYLFLALLPAYFDRATGSLGKFYLFRPSSLILLLWLAVVVAGAGALKPRRLVPVAKLAALALIVPYVAFAAVSRLDAVRRTAAIVDPEERALAAFTAAHLAPSDVVLLDPRLEPAMLGVERRTGQPTLGLWKFIPTNDPEILEWFRRMRFRERLFRQGCAATPPDEKADFLLTTRGRAAALVPRCGPVVYVSSRLALLRARP